MIRKAILSGLLISLGGYGYLALGGIPGAILFTFGLVSILYLKLPLYTGKAGNVRIHIGAWGRDASDLYLHTLLPNIIGCLIVAGLFWLSSSDILRTRAAELVISRQGIPLYLSFFKALGCGVIIDICVYLYRKTGSILPTLFGVPLFILCGFIHSVADAFYLVAGIQGLSWKAAIYYPLIVLGNFLGCNIPRLFGMKSEE